MALDKYNKKRSFGKTPEPRGKAPVERKQKSLAHFVVQKHDASRLHYDFRLELDGVLKSWAVPKGPSMNPADKRLAMMVEDHPLSYADFEGSIPKGNYGAGDVIVWDRGVYAAMGTTDPEESRKRLKSGLHKGELKFVLYGEKIKGGFALVKMKTGEGSSDNAWLLVKERDEYATEDDITKNIASPISGTILPRDRVTARETGLGFPTHAPKLRQKNNPFPHDIKPMLAKLAPEPFDRDDWLFEVKWDGYRAIAEIKDKSLKIYSRNGIDFAEKYPPIIDALRMIDHDCVLDGEIIALKDRHPDFHTLQQYGDKEAPLRYAIFDLLYLDGRDLRALPLRERKWLLKPLLPENDLCLFISEHVEERGRAFFESVRMQGFEGVVAKDAASHYLAGSRSDAWLKIKNFQEQEAIIVGYTEPRGSRKNLGALVLAAYDRGALRYIGHSGGGFTGKELHDLCVTLSKDKTDESPLAEKVPINSPITWVVPRHVCQIRFSEWTPDGRMRHPIYAGLRIDKRPDEVIIERPALKNTKTSSKKQKSSEQKFTHLEKAYWPEEGYTKGDVIDYYDSVSDVMLPYLVGRPENMNRHPNGIMGKSFYQKDITNSVPDFVRLERIWSESNDKHLHYLVCDNKETLLYMANLGAIEINPWNSRVESLDNPDYMIIDLDPDTNSFDEVVRVAQETRQVLGVAGVPSYPKTSGKTGLHICVPLGARYAYDEVKTFAELIARLVSARLPDFTSVERAPAKRRGKIYVDFLQNRHGQTIAAPYSLRPVAGAPVSTPLLWGEVRKGLDPKKFNIQTIHKRLEQKGDLWKHVLGQGIDLGKAIARLEKELR